MKTNNGIQNISILTQSYNTEAQFIKDCLGSIKTQIGVKSCDLIWVNDGSDETHTAELETLLQNFESECSFCKVNYKRLLENVGIGAAINIAVEMSSHELIFKLDSDDIMSPKRIQTQYNFMQKHPECVLSSGDIRFFSMEDEKIIFGEKTDHPRIITKSSFIQKYNSTKKYWSMNQPLFCFKKSAVMSVGNYNEKLVYAEDIDIFIRLLFKYGKVHNIKIHPVLLLYRQHNTNATKKDDLFQNMLHDMIHFYIKNGINDKFTP